MALEFVDFMVARSVPLEVGVKLYTRSAPRPSFAVASLQVAHAAVLL